MQYTAETIERKIVGPYTGRRISGTSERVFDALATIEYRFDGYTVTIPDIPVRWDDEDQRQFLSGKVGVEISRKLEDIDYLITRRQLALKIERGHREIAILREQQKHLEQGQPEVIERMVRDALLHAPVRVSVRTQNPLTPAA